MLCLYLWQNIILAVEQPFVFLQGNYPKNTSFSAQEWLFYTIPRRPYALWLTLTWLNIWSFCSNWKSINVTFPQETISGRHCSKLGTKFPPYTDYYIHSIKIEVEVQIWFSLKSFVFLSFLLWTILRGLNILVLSLYRLILNFPFPMRIKHVLVSRKSWVSIKLYQWMKLVGNSV